MVQILPPATNIGVDIGKGLNAGLQNSFEYQANQSRLQQTLDKINQDPTVKNNPYVQQLMTLAPLLNHPGGSQLLGEVAPVLGKQSQAEAQRRALEQARGGRGGGGGLNQSPGQAQSDMAGQQGQMGQPGAGQQQGDKYLNPQIAQSPMSTFPTVTAGPQTQPEMSPSEKQEYALNLMSQSAALGTPMSLDKGLSQADQINNQIVRSNQTIKAEREERELAQKALTIDMVNRAKHDGLIDETNFPEGRTIVEKLALEQAGAPDKTQAWENVRTNLRGVQNARSSLLRNYDVPGLGEKGYRKLFGNYKSKEQAMNDMQRNLDVFRKHGLYDDARNLLVNNVGLGPEDTETALFPPSKQEKQGLDSFPKHMVQGPGKKLEPRELEVFPGELAKLGRPEFQKFKDKMYDYLNANKGSNLITLRGKLNQDKGYSWQDISQAVGELIDERRFSPNIEQDKQLNVIREAPLQGLGQWFDFIWKGTK